MKLCEIAKLLDIDSNSTIEISGLNSLKDATDTQITFFENKKYINDLKETKAAAIFIKEEFIEYLPISCEALITDEPYLKLALASKLFAKPLIESYGDSFIDKSAVVMPNAYIGKNCKIGANSTIMSGVFIGDNSTVGADSIIYPNATIYRDTIIGDETIIHSGAVVGSDGFGFAHTKDGRHIKIYQNGNVVVGNRVEIGANSTIDRAVFGSTIIKDGVKIDNLVQIAHNCEIGENSIIVSQSGISGSSILGRNVIMGGQSATTGHLKIAPFTTITARGAVTKTIKESGQMLSGFPIRSYKEWIKGEANLIKLSKQKIKG
jgi:UDP-3-O-[3-hydroxymyristoyl] glucosamine N-acyltransferase